MTLDDDLDAIFAARDRGNMVPTIAAFARLHAEHPTFDVHSTNLGPVRTFVSWLFVEAEMSHDAVMADQDVLSDSDREAIALLAQAEQQYAMFLEVADLARIPQPFEQGASGESYDYFVPGSPTFAFRSVD